MYVDIGLTRQTKISHSTNVSDIIDIPRYKIYAHYMYSVVAWSIVFFTWVHTIAHLNNVAQLSAKNNQGFIGFLRAGFLTGPTWTGWIMLISLMAMVFTSLEGPRRKNFERFWYTHHLFVVFFVFWSMHGIFCMIPTDFQPFCSGIGVFYQFWIYGAVVYLVERIAREIRGRHKTYISKVIQHPSNVVEIQIKKKNTKTRAGQVGALSLSLSLGGKAWYTYIYN